MPGGYNLGVGSRLQLISVAIPVATATTYGAYTQLSSSTPFEAAGIFVMFGPTGLVTGHTTSVEIAIGAAGAEVPLIDGLQLTIPNGFDQIFQFLFPIGIPAGVRLASRAKDSASNALNNMAVYLMAGGRA